MIQFLAITAAVMAINFVADVKEEYDQIIGRTPEDEEEETQQ